MTYCITMKVKDGLVGLADTRVTSGKETITAKKITIRQKDGDRHAFYIMTSGLRSIKDKAITYFQEVIDEQDTKFNKLYKAVNALAEQIRRVAKEDKHYLKDGGLDFNLYALVAGQLEEDAEPKLYMLYPEGNWIEVGESSPYFIIGSTGFGKPLLDRVLHYDSTMEFALKAGFLSFNATQVSSNDVDYPIDVVVYKKDSFRIVTQRFDREEMRQCAKWWQEKISKGIQELPDDWAKRILEKVEK